MALVFQEYNRSLFPWMTVRQNVALPLRRKRFGKEGRQRLAEEAIEAVDLTPFIDRYPWQLSGGMQQRVAIARALAYQPSLLLMDEPFASVDAQTRADLEDLILRLVQRFRVTVLFVTHDIDEAVYLGDRIVVLTPGPARVADTVAVELPKPRDQIETKGLAEFSRLRTDVHRLIKRKARSDAATPSP
jgi:NitT/TauT family transport system ATP-binding protein